MTIRLPAALLTADDSAALSYLHSYFAPGAFTGSLFDTWDSTGTRAADRNQFTADDLVAVTMLSVEVPPRAAAELLKPNSPFNHLLSRIGADQDLAHLTIAPSAVDPVWVLDQKLRELPGVGRTIASKLMARKRPRLVPIYDTVVAKVMQLNPTHWVPLHAELRRDDSALHGRLTTLAETPGLPEGISPLRVLDVVAWMEGRAHKWR